MKCRAVRKGSKERERGREGDERSRMKVGKSSREKMSFHFIVREYSEVDQETEMSRENISLLKDETTLKLYTIAMEIIRERKINLRVYYSNVTMTKNERW